MEANSSRDFSEGVQTSLGNIVVSLQAASRDTESVLLELSTRSRDLIAVYHTLKGHLGVKLGNWLKLNIAGRWMHKLRSDNLRFELRLSIRGVNEWKRLLSCLVMKPSVEVFERNIDSHYADRLN